MSNDVSPHEWRRLVLLKVNAEFLKEARILRSFGGTAVRTPYDYRSPIEHTYDKEFLRQIRIAAD